MGGSRVLTSNRQRGTDITASDSRQTGGMTRMPAVVDMSETYLQDRYTTTNTHSDGRNGRTAPAGHLHGEESTA